MRIAIATPKAVSKAVDDLSGMDLDPTVERVRQRIGGGSYSTINKLLSEELTRRRKDALKAAELPPEMARFGAELGTKIAAEIHQYVHAAADARIVQAETEARVSIAAAEAARSEAGLEIERLEALLEDAAEDLTKAEEGKLQAQTRTAVAEGRVTELTREMDRQAQALVAAEDMRRRSIEEAAQLRGQVATLERVLQHREKMPRATEPPDASTTPEDQKRQP